VLGAWSGNAIDESDPVDGIGNRVQTWRYSSVLDHRYALDGSSRPFMIDSPELINFQREPKLEHLAAGPSGGELVDFHRVGQTHMIIPMKRTCPWPLSWRAFF
jgi:hypothetical protein